MAARLYLSTDGAKSWRPVAMAGLPQSSVPYTEELFVSPRFRTAGTIYAQTSDALYQSTDLGESFSLVSPVAGTRVRQSTAVSAERIGGAVDRDVLAYAGNGSVPPMRIDPPAHTPVAGSPDREVRFLLPPGAAPFALAERLDPGTDATAVLYRCDAQLRCDEQLHVFPTGQQAWRVWTAPDFATSRRVWVATNRSDSHGGRGNMLWVSTDGGDTFKEEPTTASLSRRIAGYKSVTVQLDLAYASARRVYLRASWAGSGKGATSASAPARHQLFRSDDGGRTWRVVAYSRHGQAGPKGTLPWVNAWTLGTAQPTLFAPDANTVAALGGDFTPYLGLFCSRDAGRTWRKTC